ncbi:hypothetical protein BCR33DRAFT_734374 [Rhizoclosmatium globosum]|uniref:GH18 domain-containing protein n=1 Tax=Rhizoclosmatium globosum TaxID=329046 RepID=A0A1Y2CU33_9FUNG|nr:hypothetical protein BCR33DRAFT_734374 [Rhizoclosmatium globosum]|eukprot:ORY50406.1 hypothetical protein BCR33DRAFT_734374 [Rhizoclosmatium globosum]
MQSARSENKDQFKSDERCSPHFSKDLHVGGGYLTVHQAVGDLIDFYNVQFYNQNGMAYDTCQSIFYASGGGIPGTSVFEIAKKGIPLNKLVVGKPISWDGVVNSGYMDPWIMATCLPDAKAKGWDAGVMGWQYSLDPSYQWISALNTQL